METSRWEQLARAALDRGRGGAILVTHEIDQAELAKGVEGFHHVTVQSILDGTAAEVPAEAFGLVVTGYDPKYARESGHMMYGEEWRIEDWVTDQVLARRREKPAFQVLVLAHDLPFLEVFTNQHYRWSRWWPGLDEEDRHVYVINFRGGELLQARIEMIDKESTDRLYVWKTVGE